MLDLVRKHANSTLIPRQGSQAHGLHYDGLAAVHHAGHFHARAVPQNYGHPVQQWVDSPLGHPCCRPSRQNTRLHRLVAWLKSKPGAETGCCTLTTWPATSSSHVSCNLAQFSQERNFYLQDSCGMKFSTNYPLEPLVLGPTPHKPTNPVSLLG